MLLLMKAKRESWKAGWRFCELNLCHARFASLLIVSMQTRGFGLIIRIPENYFRLASNAQFEIVWLRWTHQCDANNPSRYNMRNANQSLVLKSININVGWAKWGAERRQTGPWIFDRKHLNTLVYIILLSNFVLSSFRRNSKRLLCMFCEWDENFTNLDWQQAALLLI